jgi:hypothetical protein
MLQELGGGEGGTGQVIGSRREETTHYQSGLGRGEPKEPTLLSL